MFSLNMHASEWIISFYVRNGCCKAIFLPEGNLIPIQHSGM